MSVVKEVPENLKPAVNLFKELTESTVLGYSSSGLWNSDIENNSGILIAVSGGSDSIGLMNIAKIALPERHLVAGLIDHGLRDGTFDEWLLVKKEAERLRIKAVRKEITKPELVAPGQKEGLQQWARNKRYALLEEIAKEEGCKVIATGHTEDDQAETVILRILRGAGIDGLGAIPKLRKSKTGVTIIRPLINVTRNSIIEWLNSSNIKYATDPSNKNLKFTRVKIRDEILVPLKEINSGVSKHLAELAEESAFLSDFFDTQILNEDGFKKLNLLNGIKVTADVFNKYPKHFHSRIIRAALK
ncbi:MAG: tRNA lysidine(34) synthetase TilS, partial [Deltaproteobacteria bacterium]|nr:tRNA lysidine(34) synthetase TilS [Deltaproteobacteria bacterium]